MNHRTTVTANTAADEARDATMRSERKRRETCPKLKMSCGASGLVPLTSPRKALREPYPTRAPCTWVRRLSKYHDSPDGARTTQPQYSCTNPNAAPPS